MSFLGIVRLLGMAPEKSLYLWQYDPAADAPIGTQMFHSQQGGFAMIAILPEVG